MVVELLRGFNVRGDVEVLVSKVFSEGLLFEGGTVFYPFSGEDYSADVRVTLSDGRFGAVSVQNVEDGLRKALVLARNSKPVVRNSVSVAKSFPRVELNDDVVEAIGLSDLKSRVVEGLERLRSAGLRVQSCSVTKSRVSDLFYNSEGVSVSDSTVHVSVGFEVVTKSGFPLSGYRTFSTNPDVGGVVDSLLREAKLFERLEKPRGGVQSVVLGYGFLNSFFSDVFSRAVNGFNFFKGVSPFKVGGVVGCDSLTVVNDPLLRHGLFSQSFDAEGTPSKSTTIIKGGVFKSFLNDNFSASLNSTVSTSSCFSLLSKPSIEPSNLVIQPVERGVSVSDLVGEVKSGVLVEEVSGTHLVNHVSGDFGNSIFKGFLIEDGELVAGLKSGMVVGNFFDLLKSDLVIGGECVQKGLVVAPPVLANVKIVV